MASTKPCSSPFAGTVRTAAALSLLLAAGLLCLVTSPVSASSAGYDLGGFTYDTFADHASAGGSMAGGGAATRKDSRSKWARPAAIPGRSARDLSVDFVAPRTTPGTAIEPMWAQAPNRDSLAGGAGWTP